MRVDEMKSRRPPPLNAKPSADERPPELPTELISSGGDDPTGSSEQRDPRQRLDALARLLDKRVKQTGTNPAVAVAAQKGKS